jgi:hypothetical protein
MRTQISFAIHRGWGYALLLIPSIEGRSYMRSAIGKTLRFLGKAGYWIVSFVGFIIAMTVVNEKTGFWGFVVAFIVAPMTFAAVPWYLLIARGNPFLLVFNYGGLLFSFFLQWLGDKISPRPLWEQR